MLERVAPRAKNLLEETVPDVAEALLIAESFVSISV